MLYIQHVSLKTTKSTSPICILLHTEQKCYLVFFTAEEEFGLANTLASSVAISPASELTAPISATGAATALSVFPD